MSSKQKYTQRLYSIEDLENLLEYIPYEIWLKDKEGKHVYINQKGADKLGLKKEDIIGKTDMEIRPKEIWEKCNLTDEQVIKEQKPLFYEDEFNENKEYYYRVYKFPIKNSKGNMTLHGGIANEVTHNKYIYKGLEDLFNEVQNLENKNIKYIEALSEVLTNLNEMIQSTSINLFFIDETKEKLNLSISSNNESIFSKNASININYEEFSEDYKSKLKVNLQDELNNKFKKIYKDKLNIKDNSIFKIIPLNIDSNLVGLIYIYYENEHEDIDSNDVFIHDIAHRINNFLTNLKLQEKLQEKLYKSNKRANNLQKGVKILEETLENEILKVNFLENMSHEFKTPINIILMISKLLLSNENNEINLEKEKRLEYLNSLKQNSYRILRLVNNILDSTNFEKNLKELEVNNYNIINIIEDIVMYSADYIKTTNKSIVFDTEEEEVIIACNPSLIEKIMLNLISNSIKFTDDNGQIEVDIKVNKEENRLYVHLKNDGESISKEDSEIIFSKFVQVEDHTRRQNEGSGMGLYLVKCLIEAHQGKIWLNTEVTSGVEFIFYLPINIIEKENVKVYSIEEHSVIDKCNIEFSDIYFN